MSATFSRGRGCGPCGQPARVEVGRWDRARRRVVQGLWTSLRGKSISDDGRPLVHRPVRSIARAVDSQHLKCIHARAVRGRGAVRRVEDRSSEILSTPRLEIVDRYRSVKETAPKEEPLVETASTGATVSSTRKKVEKKRARAKK